MVLLLNKITKIESNSQQNNKIDKNGNEVLLLNKITKIESNSQLAIADNAIVTGCFYWTKLQKLKAILNIYLKKNIFGALGWFCRIK